MAENVKFQYDFAGCVTYVEHSGNPANIDTVPVGASVKGRYTYFTYDEDPGRFKFQVAISFGGYSCTLYYDSAGDSWGIYTVVEARNAVFTWNNPLNCGLEECYFPSRGSDVAGKCTMHLLEIESPSFVGLGFVKFSVGGVGSISLDFHVSHLRLVPPPSHLRVNVISEKL